MRRNQPPIHRKLLAIPAVVAAFALVASGATAANAADPTPFIVVGTSDVFDSNLIQSVIEPQFEAAYPQYDLQYVSKGTGAAITYAEAGTADALVVHAASVENQFVQAGYSDESFGRAIFWGDYVLLGPASDPAGVLNGSTHDIATAFEKVAAAGEAGTANFVSRGGTPGTTIQEHAIWDLTSHVNGCRVSDANGGGISPSTATGSCPSTINYPAWYHATGLTQGPNIINADTCNYTGGGCYVLTDRGTYQYLKSTSAITNLGIVTRDNATTARGSNTALVNSFHAYAINAAKFPGQTRPINTDAARKFLNFVTSPTEQTAIGNYLSNTDPPFIPSAAPSLTASTLPASVDAGDSFTVTGTLANVTPGTPALANQTVHLDAVPTTTPTADPVSVATATTTSSGAYSITYKPTVDQTYSVSTNALTQIENATLNPAFGDILAGSSKALSAVMVNAAPATSVSISKISVSKSYVATVTATISPKSVGTGGKVKLYGLSSKSTKNKRLETVSVKNGVTTVKLSYKLSTVNHSWKTLTWKLYVLYLAPGFETSRSTTKTVKLT